VGKAEFLENINIGTCYYPEHWPRERWETDAENMADMGLAVVRLAELAWSFMERRDGEFDFDWLEEFIAIAGKKGVKTLLGTPQEAAPMWLQKSHPEIVRVDETGLTHGGRGLHCHNNQVFRFYAARITREMARRFGNNPHVIGWQIDNELHGVECYCSSCQHAFRVWLRKKYGSVEKLNEAWGARFWSHHYNSLEEVDPPSNKLLTTLTSHVLDFKRFMSDSTVDFQNEQVRIIRDAAPGHFISHNSLGLYPHINMYHLAKELDVMSWDTYPSVDDDYVNVNKSHDMIRATRHDNFLMLEQKNGYFNGANYNLAIKPGLVRAWGMLDISRGANAVLYYRYRANRWGTEQNPNGILRHDGSKRRAYYEIQQLTQELKPLSKKLGKTKVSARVAIIHSYDDLWAFHANKQYTNYDVNRLENDFYRALLSRGVTADLIHPEDDLSRYSVVIAPNLMLVSQKTANNMYQFVEAGGTAVFHIRCGQKDTENVMVDIPWPGLLRELCGVSVDEFEAFPEGASSEGAFSEGHNSVQYRGKSYPVRWWADILTADTAETEGVYERDFYRGKSALTVNRRGKGKAVYFGAAGCEELIGDYLDALFAECGIKTLCLPDRVFVTERKSGEATYTFAVNMGYQPAEFKSDIRGTDVLTGKAVDGKIRLEPLQTMIIELT
jgi:beta-galactosidase